MTLNVETFPENRYKFLKCKNNDQYFKEYRSSNCYYCNYCKKDICLSNRNPHLLSEKHLNNKRLSSETFTPEIFLHRRFKSL